MHFKEVAESSQSNSSHHINIFIPLTTSQKRLKAEGNEETLTHPCIPENSSGNQATSTSPPIELSGES